MSRTYRTAAGKVVNIDNLILANEDTIAVGNMGVNARGDELGPGGQVVATRNQNMNDYYKLNTETSNPGTGTQPVPPKMSELTADELEFEQEEAMLPPISKPALRGNLADSLVKETVIPQPSINENK